MLIKVIFLTIFVTSAAIENTFHRTLQGYRVTLLELQGTSLPRLDKAFFEVYDALNELLKSMSGNLGPLYNVNTTCRNFSSYKTTFRTQTKLTTFCTNVVSISKHTADEMQDLISAFHYGTLGADTEPLKLAEYIWDTATDSLNLLPLLLEKSFQIIWYRAGSRSRVGKRESSLEVHIRSRRCFIPNGFDVYTRLDLVERNPIQCLIQKTKMIFFWL